MKNDLREMEKPDGKPVLIVCEAIAELDFERLAHAFAQKISARIVASPHTTGDANESLKNKNVIRLEYGATALLLSYVAADSSMVLTTEFAGNACVLADIEEMLAL